MFRPRRTLHRGLIGRTESDERVSHVSRGEGEDRELGESVGKEEGR